LRASSQRDEGFNYGVNSAVTQSLASRKFIKSSLGYAFFSRSRARARERDASERAASTCGIMVLIMCASGSYDRNLSPTKADPLRYDVSLRGVSQLITTLIIRSLAHGYTTKIYCSQQPIMILFFSFFLFRPPNRARGITQLMAELIIQMQLRLRANIYYSFDFDFDDFSPSDTAIRYSSISISISCRFELSFIALRIYNANLHRRSRRLQSCPLLSSRRLQLISRNYENTEIRIARSRSAHRGDNGTR